MNLRKLVLLVVWGWFVGCLCVFPLEIFELGNFCYVNGGILILFYIYNLYFEQMVGQIYPTELQLNKAKFSDTEPPLGLLTYFLHDGWHSFI